MGNLRAALLLGVQNYGDRTGSTFPFQHLEVNNPVQVSGKKKLQEKAKTSLC